MHSVDGGEMKGGIALYGPCRALAITAAMFAGPATIGGCGGVSSVGERDAQVKFSESEFMRRFAPAVLVGTNQAEVARLLGAPYRAAPDGETFYANSKDLGEVSRSYSLGIVVDAAGKIVSAKIYHPPAH